MSNEIDSILKEIPDTVFPQQDSLDPPQIYPVSSSQLYINPNKYITTANATTIVTEEEPEEATTDEEIIDNVLEMTKEDRKQAGDVFDMFYDKLLSGRDYSPSTKEFIVKALEVKVNASRNLIDLLRIKNKKADTFGNNVIYNTTSSFREGINLERIKNEV